MHADRHDVSWSYSNFFFEHSSYNTPEERWISSLMRRAMNLTSPLLSRDVSLVLASGIYLPIQFLLDVVSDVDSFIPPRLLADRVWTEMGLREVVRAIAAAILRERGIHASLINRNLA